MDRADFLELQASFGLQTSDNLDKLGARRITGPRLVKRCGCDVQEVQRCLERHSESGSLSYGRDPALAEVSRNEDVLQVNHDELLHRGIAPRAPAEPDSPINIFQSARRNRSAIVIWSQIWRAEAQDLVLGGKTPSLR